MTDSGSAAVIEKFERARALHQQGHLPAARDMYQQVLALQPLHFDALNLLGVLSGQSKDLPNAVEYFTRAISVDPSNAAAYCNLGLALNELQRPEAAVLNFDQAIALNEQDAVAYYSRGNILRGLRQFERAMADYDKAVSINPHFAQAYFNRGLLLQQTQQLEAALGSYDQAVGVKPDYVEAYANKAFLLYALKRFDESIMAYDRAIALFPNHAPTHVHRGNTLKELNRLDEALASYDRAIGIDAGYAEAYLNRGVILRGLNRIDAALESYDKAIAARPAFADAYFNRASLLRVLNRFEAAAADYKIAGQLNPEIKFLAGALLETRMQVCDMSNFDEEVARISAGVERGEAVAHPFAFLTFSDSPSLQRKAAEIWVHETCYADYSLGPIANHAPHKKIRIGYFSPDFREHPVARLVVELIELHDRSKFEIIGFSFGSDSKDDLNQRLRRAFDQYFDVHRKSDVEITMLARSLSVDIAVDLGGYTHNSRPNIFAARSAPIQVSYIGYLGTMGAEYMDYLIADTTLISADDRQYYREKIIYLPSYQVNDSKRRTPQRSFSRQELNLPATGVVYSCFNSNYKITAPTFAVWMRILNRVKESVLFLYAGNATVERNLLQEASRSGIDSRRIVFGKRLELDEYAARLRNMDLFLDTLPYNAGTTASDALWAGLPVLTCKGRGFAGRVAASLLNAIGLHELVAETVDEYEELAVTLGSNPHRLAEIKKKLAEHRLTRPLFDSRLFTDKLEAAYTAIHNRQAAGLSPDHIM